MSLERKPWCAVYLNVIETETIGLSGLEKARTAAEMLGNLAFFRMAFGVFCLGFSDAFARFSCLSGFSNGSRECVEHCQDFGPWASGA